MNAIAQREMVKRAYPSRKWTIKVDGMNEMQVYAIYLRLRRKGKI